MNKIVGWFKESNRGKHLIGGYLVALYPNNFSDSLYVSIVAAGCLEFKDRSYGNEWDWIDFTLTVLGGLLGGLTKKIAGW